ncbi:MAG: DUF2460 domain-containing protein [Deltaproteobacteria bacterium]|nr:DUF2460 domain-containing protein [Deltaproteobacteria bacterium]
MADTYPLVPNRITNVGIEYKTNIIEYEQGHEQRSSRWESGKKTFKLSHKMLEKDGGSYDTLLNFFNEKKGMFQKFYFVNHIDGITYEVRFNSDNLNFEHINAKFADCEVEVITC